MFTDPPFDLMYGFRGHHYDVDLLSPYEMLLWWNMARIVAPTRFAENPKSEWTPLGRAYTKACQAQKQRPEYKAGIHYVAVEEEDRNFVARYPSIVFTATSLVLGAAQAARHTYVVIREGPPSKLLARREREDALRLHAPMDFESARLHETQPIAVIVGEMRCDN